MADVSHETGDTFDWLLTAMPRIAEAVNAFTSEKNQRAALDALVQAIGITPVMPIVSSTPLTIVNDSWETTAPEEQDGVEEQINAPNGATKPSSRRRRTGRKAEPVRDIDFRPEGKQAFKDLIEEKRPTTIDQKNVIAVFWLEQVAGIEGIGVGHVMAAYKDRNWREPADSVNSLQATASREHWIDTKNMKAIVTTPSGRNQVNHEMPMAKAKK